MKPLDLLFCIFLALGIIQGLIFAGILVKQQGKLQQAQRFLAIIMCFFAYRLSVELLKLLGYLDDSLLSWTFLELNWLYGSLIYLFVRALVSPKIGFTLSQDWWHLLPVLLEISIASIIHLTGGSADTTDPKHHLTAFWTSYPIPFFISMLLIIYYSVKSLNIIHKSSKDETLDKSSIKWLIGLLVILRNFSVIVFIIVLMDFLFLDYVYTKIYLYPIFMGMAALTYWLGLEGVVRRKQLF